MFFSVLHRYTRFLQPRFYFSITSSINILSAAKFQGTIPASNLTQAYQECDRKNKQSIKEFRRQFKI